VKEKLLAWGHAGLVLGKWAEGGIVYFRCVRFWKTWMEELLSILEDRKLS
jgi:hypothetical protein